MISILIPIYNFDVTKLVTGLNEQCKQLEIDYEIVCFDDCSKPKYKNTNKALDLEFGVSYIELSENYGRAKIRNKLAQNARYDHLIFLDCDSKLERKDFISNYISHIDKTIVYGGRKYQEKPPRTSKKYLHWKFGTRRESLPCKKRSKAPYLNFQTNNFMVKRDLMLRYPFDQTIKGYGYEDLLFAALLKREGVAVYHIENEVIHHGIEYNEDFLNKTKTAAENLAILYHQGELNDTRMLKFHKKVKKIGFNSLLHKLLQRRTDRFLKNLNSDKPNLLFFDLYRYDIFLSKLNELKASFSL